MNRRECVLRMAECGGELADVLEAEFDPEALERKQAVDRIVRLH